jgi:hypothetical protein
VDFASVGSNKEECPDEIVSGLATSFQIKN